MRKDEVHSLDTEYVAVLNGAKAADIQAMNDAQEQAEWTACAEAERRAWSNRYERCDEARLEMEADDARCGGTFSELMYG